MALPRLVLEYREITKLRTTFLEPLASKAIAGADGGLARLYTQWHMLATGTGRLSSRHPNVQQVPKSSITLQPGDTEDGGSAQHHAGAGSIPREISVRSAFIAPAGCMLVSADYTQLEMRLLGHFSGDAKLRDVLHTGGDLFKVRTLAGSNANAHGQATSSRRGERSNSHHLAS